jgi:hypothetical protein
MLSDPIRQLLESYRIYLEKQASQGDLPKIHVDEIAAKVAAFYERVRNIVDFQEEHLLRKRFIDRTFRRRLLFSAFNPDIAEGLIKETIRAGHLPNDSVPEQKIEDVRRIIDRGQRIGEKIKDDNLYDWFLNFVVCEIEDALFPPDKRNMLGRLMFSSIRTDLDLINLVLDPTAIDLHLFAAIQKTLFRLDPGQVSYQLFNFIYPRWQQEENDERIIEELGKARKAIETEAEDTNRQEFINLCNRYNTVFYLIGDLLEENPPVDELEEILESDKKRDEEITRLYRRRYSREKQRLGRLAFLSVISFFITKMAVAFAVEIPLDRHLGTFSWGITAANIFLPPVILIVILAGIRMPSSNNLRLVLDETGKIVSGEGAHFSIVFPKKKGPAARGLVWFFYALLVVAVFYFSGLILIRFGFSLANAIIFLLFTSIVAAIGVKINNRSKDLSLEKDQPSFLSFLIDSVSMPFVSVGKVVLAGLGKFNILVTIATFFIELPFQLFVRALEVFHGFIKDQKERIG